MRFSGPPISTETNAAQPPLARRQRVVNSFTNPTAGAATTGVITTSGGLAIARITGLTDGPSPDVTTAFRLVGTPNNNVNFVWGGAAAPIDADSSQVSPQNVLVHAACYVRTPVAKGPTVSSLYITFTDAANTPLANQTFLVNTRRMKVNAEWTLIEGFAFGPSATRRAYMTLAVIGVDNAPTDVQATCLTAVVNPVGSVPVLPAGGRLGHAFAGPANAAPSWAFARPQIFKPHGFNDNAVAYTEPSIRTMDVSLDEDVQINVEVGATHIRGGVHSQGQISPWPSQAAEIDWRPTYYGKYLEKMRDAGLKAIPIIFNAPAWMTHLWSDQQTDQEFQQIGALYAKLVEQYGDVIEAVECGNENNHTGFWGTNISASRYVAKAAACYAAIKAVDPTMTVIAGNTTPSTVAGVTKWDTWLSAAYAAGLKDVSDAISIHPYPTAMHSGADSANATFADGFTGHIYKALELMDANGDTAKNLWLTEFGVPTNGSNTPLTLNVVERQQAQMLPLLVGMADRHPRIDGVFVHDLWNINTSTERWGVVDWPRFRRRQAFYALQQSFGKAPEPRVWGPWRYVGDAGDPAFGANWSNVGTLNNERLAFRENGQAVQVRGRIKRSNGAPVAGEEITTLPVGVLGDVDFRPKQTANPASLGYVNATGKSDPGIITIGATNAMIQWWTGDPTVTYTIDAEYPLT